MWRLAAGEAAQHVGALGSYSTSCPESRTRFNKEDGGAMKSVSFGMMAATVSALALCLTACSQTAGQNQTQDAVLGAVAGGLLGGAIGGAAGNQVVGALAGAAIGGIVGAGIGNYLDEQDRAQLADMTEATAQTGTVGHYYNPKTKVRLTTRPAAAATASATSNCKDVDQELTLADGTTKKGSVRACRTGNEWTYS